MHAILATFEGMAARLREPKVIDAIRALDAPPVRSMELCHTLGLAAQTLGNRDSQRIALDEYGRAFSRWTEGLPDKRVMLCCDYIFLRIGEMAANLGALARLQRLGWLPVDPVLFVREGTCNPAYLDLWRRHFEIFTDAPDLPRFRSSFLPGPDGNFLALNDAFATAFQADNEPLLSLSPAHLAAGREKLESLGLPKDAWFACLHARSPAYLNQMGIDDSHNAHRNSDIRTFEQAALRIAERGGWTVRIGAPDTIPLDGWPNTLDLPHLVPSTDWLDVYALGACRFFLGDGSGPQMVAATFDRPLVCANFELGYAPIASASLHTPKLLRKNGRLLTIGEATEAGLIRLQYAKRLTEKGAEIVDNTPEDIATMVSEFLDGALVSHEAQDRYRNAFPPDVGRFISMASPAFLEKHAGLLAPFYHDDRPGL